MSQADPRSKRRWLSFWGPIVGLVGGLIGIIGGGISILERVLPPSLVVHDVVPVFVYGEETVGEFKRKSRGVSMIARVSSGGRPVSISGIEAVGRRYLEFNEWLGYFSEDSADMDDLGETFRQHRAFYNVSFSGWLTDSRAPVRLAPHEEMLVRFTFSEAREVYRPKIVDLKYVGLDDAGQEPTTRRVHPDWQDFFLMRSNGMAGDIRKELREGGLQLRLVAGSDRIPVSSTVIFKPKNASIRDWYEKPIHYLYADRFN